MPKFNHDGIIVEAHQWFKNGDHPDDRAGEFGIDWVALGQKFPHLFEAEYPIGEKTLDGKLVVIRTDLDVVIVPDPPLYEFLEGRVVRYFRNPSHPGQGYHFRCEKTWDEHGWIDEGDNGRTVCPSNWIVTDNDGSHYPVPEPAFSTYYKPVEEPANVSVQ